MSQKYTKEFKETIVQLHEAGQPVSDLVKKYGVANQTIYKYVSIGYKSTLYYCANYFVISSI
ncbi:helix-turn-helix domain-containing protein [Streptococcus vestibularis]|uniref:helix-turn-helix domain-containing protein n=1 Tax=Streptococcus vestibularis TaxID=1343 RepID=UPI0026EB771F|nr:helix-turn-helix domain-containing protein [Streptococcus vestibularis]